jgi:hypothetical protein
VEQLASEAKLARLIRRAVGWNALRFGWQECCIEEAVVGVAVTQLATTTAAGRRDRCGRVRKQHVGFLQSNSWERRTAAAKKKGTQKRKNVSARRIDEKKR